MKKVILSFLVLSAMLMAELTQVWSTPGFADKGIKIIDIRTPAEWKETGIVKGSYTIMFFDQKGNFNVAIFLKQLDMVVKKNLIGLHSGIFLGTIRGLLTTGQRYPFVW